jgi:hypothetical protein
MRDRVDEDNGDADIGPVILQLLHGFIDVLGVVVSSYGVARAQDADGLRLNLGIVRLEDLLVEATSIKTMPAAGPPWRQRLHDHHTLSARRIPRMLHEDRQARLNTPI